VGAEVKDGARSVLKVFDLEEVVALFSLEVRESFPHC
jgi:hypothetical protein